MNARSMMATKNPRSHDDYTVGWICALPLEMAAAKLMLDVIHPTLPIPSTDQNTYILGNIGDHNIVVVCLPPGVYGTISAATVVMQLLYRFHSIRFGLLVGIGSGVPSSNADIRLGDVVVSQPDGTSGGVIQYDLGKASSGSQFQQTGMLNRPPKFLLTALATLQAHHLTEDTRIHEFFSNISVKTSRQAINFFARPSQEDCLYQTEYDHGSYTTCANCDPSKLISRPSRGHNKPVVHYGLIASINKVIKDGRLRDQLGQKLGVSCVEMEAVGLMDYFPCLVIRGICDYADSHKNKEWQGYAAAVAAAYAKDLLSVIPINQVNNTPITRNALIDSVYRFYIPFNLIDVPAIENFLGRNQELEHLWHHLQPENSKSRKVAILHGLGGMGKTQLAIRFAQAHKDDFTAIFLISGKDRETLLQALSSILPRLPGQGKTIKATNKEEIEQHARQVLQWLAIPGNSHWLLIFDNIDQYSPVHRGPGDGYDISEFFPIADHGSILITSRMQSLTELGKSFPIQKLEFKDAIRLLLQGNSFVENTGSEHEYDPDILSLVRRLDGLPLAIVIAGAFMRETGTNIAEYLQYYEESWSDLQTLSYPGRQYQQGNILQTWMISYREIQKRDPNAAKLLLLLACFDNRDIWYELVKSGSHSHNTPAWFDKIISKPLAFKISMKTLIEFSLIETTQQGGSYTMHPVVQDWCLHITDKEHDAKSVQLNELALVSVGYMVPSNREQNYWELQRRLLAHAYYVHHRWNNDQLASDIAIWGAFHGLGNLYSDQGKLKEAEEMYQRALIGREKTLGPDHTSTLESVNNLGVLYQNQDQLKDAEEMYQRALIGREKALGPEHISTLESVNNLGNLYRYQGKLKEAEEMYQRALVGCEKALGPDHTSTLESVNNLGILYHNQDQLKVAEKMYQRALIGREKALGPDHTSTLQTVNNLGNLYRYQGKLKEAEKMYQRALVGREKALGPDHTSTLQAVNNLGILYHNQGKLKEAEEMYQRALVGREKALGPDHTSSLQTVNNLGNLYRYQGKLKEAEEMYQRALIGHKKALGPDHTSTLQTINNLGNLYRYQGKLKEAEEMYQRALVGREKALGPDHTSTLQTVNNLGNLYRYQGKLKELKEAEEMYQRALIGREKALGPDHTSILLTVNRSALSVEGSADAQEDLDDSGSVSHNTEYGPFTDTESKEKSMAPLTSTNGQTWKRSANESTLPTTVQSDPRPDETGPQKLQVQDDDDISVQSVDTVEMTLEEERQVSWRFTQAIHDKLQPDLYPTGSDDYFKKVIDGKLKKFSKAVKKDTPKTFESKPKRKIVKAIYRLRYEIMDQLETIITQEDETEHTFKKPPTIIGRTEGIPKDSSDQKVLRYLNQGFDQAYDPNKPEDSQVDPDTDQASEGSESSTNSLTNTQPDYSILHNYVTTHEAFHELVGQIDLLIRHCRTNILGNIRRSVINCIDSTDGSTDYPSEFHANFDVDWDLPRVLRTRHDFGLAKYLRGILTITGNSQDAQLETVARYFSQTWPSHNDTLLSALEGAASGIYRQSPGTHGSILEVSLKSGHVLVSVKGSSEFLVDVAQQLAWLGAACRSWSQLPTQHENALVYCDTVWTRDNSSVNTFRVSYNIVPFDDDEPLSSWHSLVGESSIVTGFSTMGHANDENGLVVSQEILHADVQNKEGIPSWEDASGGFTKVVISNRPSCDRFEELLENFDHPRTLASLEKALRKRFDTVVFEQGLLLLRPSLREVVEFTPKYSIQISSVNDTSLMNKAKAYIEDSTAFEWDWWPLMPRVPDLSPGRVRLRWKLCGHYLYELISPEEADSIRQLLGLLGDHPPKRFCCETEARVDWVTIFHRTYRSIANILKWRILSPSLVVQMPSSIAQQRYTPATTSASSVVMHSSAQTTRQIASGSRSGSPIQVHGSSSIISTAPQGDPLLIVFGIKDMREFDEIENIETSSELNDPSFFKELKTRFSKHRWFLQRWCSPFRFQYCKFVQFETINTGQVYCRREALPDDHGYISDYEYNPRPPDAENPLIDPKLFSICLKACDIKCSRSLLLPFLHKCRPLPHGSLIWKRIPRKKGRFNTSLSQPGEVAFGIEADYMLSFAIIFIYHIVPIILAFSFWIYWLKNHPNDLQNASVPIFTVLGFIGTFWAFLGRRID